MTRGNKAKYLPLIPSLELDNTKTYTHVDVAIKLGTRHFDREKKTQNAIRQALARADENLKRGEAHPGWMFKRLASQHYPDWNAEWFLIQADLTACSSEVAPILPVKPRPVRWVTLLGGLEVATILCIACLWFTWRYRVTVPKIPLGAFERERLWMESSDEKRHAVYYHLKDQEP